MLTPGTNARRAFFGALEVLGGHWHWADHDRKLAVHFVASLDHLLAAYLTGPLYLVLDNAPTHTAQAITRWATAHPRAQLLWLPTYAAHEANPVERNLGLLKSEDDAGRLESGFATVVGLARRFCAELPPPRHATGGRPMPCLSFGHMLSIRPPMRRPIHSRSGEIVP